MAGIFKPYTAPYRLSFPITIEFLGQSNAGKISAQTLLPSDLLEDIPTNWEYYNSGSVWRRLSASVPNGPYPGTFHIERKFMKLMSNYYNGQRIYLRQNSFSSTSINTWQPGQATYISSTTFATNANASRPEVAPLKVVFWLQGEADCSDPTTYNNYANLLTNVINQKRTDYGNSQLVFVLVSLSTGQTSLNSTGRTAINTAMQTVAANLTNVYYIAQNEPTQDTVHYSPTGAGNIGIALFNWFISYQFPY